MTNIALIEPMLPEEGHSQLEDKVLELATKASALAARLHPIVGHSVGDLVRSMNCYYSNLIEGHDTHPVDIARALAQDFSKDKKKRTLQLEAKAHIEVQTIIDRQKIDSTVTSVAFIKWLHLEFYRRLPEELLLVENHTTHKEVHVEPGEFRMGLVQVGHHVAPSPEEITPFMERFAEAYSIRRLTRVQQIIAVAASHHRLVWIHPFYDGNGRVARLFSHAFLQKISIGTSLWSISRGLARHVNDYRAALMAADQPRQGDLDGRGNLSAKGLNHFCDFFLSVCIDQVDFMESLLEPLVLARRIEAYIEEETRSDRLPEKSWPLLREALLAGEFERGRAAAITGYKERQARTVLQALIKQGLLVSDTAKSPVRLGFPTHVVERWFPRLYPPLTSGV